MSTDEDAASARARVLSSPLRWRVLRLCLHEPRTNKDLAALLGVNPGTMLHHVRTLVATGFLQAQPARRGARNALEIPYLATQATWDVAREVPSLGSVMVDLLGEEARAVDPGDLTVWRLGVRLGADGREELIARISALFDEYRARGASASADAEADAGVRAWSLMTFLHPDPGQDAGA